MWTRDLTPSASPATEASSSRRISTAYGDDHTTSSSDAGHSLPFAALLEAAPDAVVVSDTRGVIVFVNAQAVRLFGYERQELVGEQIERLVPESARSDHPEHRAQYFAAPQTRPIGTGLDLRARRKDGSTFPAEISLSPVETDRGVVSMATVRDVTQSRREQREVDRLRRQHELLLGSVAEGIMRIDGDGKIEYANPAAATLLGYRVDDLIGQSAHDLIHHKRADGSPYPIDRCPIERSRHDNTVHHASGDVFWRRDGTSFPVDYTAAPIRQDDRFVGTSVIFSDIRERLRAEEVARRAESRILAIYDSIPEAFLAVDPAWRVVYVNPIAARMPALPKSEIIGKSLWDVFPDFAGTTFESEFRRAMAHQTRAVFEAEHPRTHRWFETVVYPSEEGVSIYARDVTERRRGEEALMQAGIARPLVRRIVQDLVEQGGVAHQILTNVGRSIAGDSEVHALPALLEEYNKMGLGNLTLERQEGQRATFTGVDLLERRPDSRVATCHLTLGYLSEALSRVNGGESTLGTEIECQSRGAERCRFIVHVKRAEEGLARRVKELI